MIELRPAIWTDLPELRRVAIETQIDTFGGANTKENMNEFLETTYNLPQLQKEWSEPGSIYTIAWDGNQLAGFVRLRRSHEADNFLGINSLELQRLYVSTAFQGKKVGTILMQYAISYAKEKEFEWLWLGVWEHNVKAQNIYARWGFTRFSEHVFYMGQDAQTDWLLKLRL